MFMELFLVGIGGFLGSCLRFIITKATTNFGASFPLGTLLSNVIAGVAIGFIVGLGTFSPKSKLFAMTGLLGGLSTFSAFSLETVTLFIDGKYFISALNVLMNFGLSLFGVALGMSLARMLKKSVLL